MSGVPFQVSSPNECAGYGQVPAIAGLRPDDRVLILGGSGWFGRTLVGLLGGQVPVLATASTNRSHYIVWDLPTIRSFAPTVVANFAFLTRDRLQDFGDEQFHAINKEQVENLRRAACLPSVRSVVTISSGAAVCEPKSSYGLLKAMEERSALALVENEAGPSVVVARTYSVSGPYVVRPEAYAFSDFVQMARLGEIKIAADRPVFRRYASVADVLRVALTRALEGHSGLFETGGELVELGILAEHVRSVVNTSARIQRPPFRTSSPSCYASDNLSWKQYTAAANVKPATLIQQIQAVQQGLPWKHSVHRGLRHAEKPDYS